AADDTSEDSADDATGSIHVATVARRDAWPGRIGHRAGAKCNRKLRRIARRRGIWPMPIAGPRLPERSVNVRWPIGAAPRSNAHSRLKRGISPDGVVFDNLGHAEVHLASYRDFKRLKEAGRIPAQIRFQVDLAHPISVVRKYVVPDEVPPLEPAYERALLGEI